MTETVKGSILIVDDEPLLVDLLCDYFTEQGHAVDIATNGGEALMLAELHRPDAVVLDIRLPDMNGAEILSRLRERDDTVSIIMLSGSDDAELARSLLKAGAFDYVQKPFKFDALERAVRIAVAVGRRKPRPGVVVPFRSDRRRPETEGASNGQASDTPCEVCHGVIEDLAVAVMDQGALAHAGCWRRARVRAR